MSAARVTIPPGDWKGNYEFVEDDGSVSWWGPMNLTVSEDSEVTGTGALNNTAGGSWTLEFDGRVRGQGGIHLQVLVSDGDRASLHSTESVVEGDTWKMELAPLTRWPSRAGHATLTKSP